MIKKIVKLWTEFPIIGSVFLFLNLFLLFSLIYINNPGVSAIDDHFFHFRFAHLLRTDWNEAVNNFKWIAAGPEGRSIVYPVTLYNLFLIPFTYISDDILALKISDIFLASLSLSLVYYAFRKYKIKWAYSWALFLLSISFFLHKMLLGRGLVLVPALVMMEFYFAQKNKYISLFLMSFLHIVWHPSTFFLPLAIVLMIECAKILDGKKGRIIGIGSYLAGSLMGIGVLSYTVSDLVSGVFAVQKTVLEESKSANRYEGGELYPMDIFQMLGDSNMVMMMVIISISFVIYWYVESKKDGSRGDKELLYASFLLVAFSLFGSLIISGRFYDLYAVSSVFLFLNVVKYLFDNDCFTISQKTKRVVSVGFVIFLLLIITNSLLNRRQQISLTDYRHKKTVSEWIADRSKENERIFLHDWGYFPVAFFYNQKNIYNNGIEPKSAMNRPDLYWKNFNMLIHGIYCEKQYDCFQEKESFDKKISSLKEEERSSLKKKNSLMIINSIKNDFGAKYVIASKEFGETLKLNPDLIVDNVEAASEYNGSVVAGFELK